MVTGRAGARYGTARPFAARPSILTGVVPATTGGGFAGVALETVSTATGVRFHRHVVITASIISTHLPHPYNNKVL
jgi:hypothetical protein